VQVGFSQPLPSAMVDPIHDNRIRVPINAKNNPMQEVDEIG
jgi:hypothetical protein